MDQSEAEERFDQFICTHFSDWPVEKPSSTEDRLRCVRAWLSEKTAPHHAAALALIARIQPVLDELQARIPAGEQSRLFSRIDTGHISKSPDAILDKMIRDFDPSQTKPPKVAFGNFADELHDLARFRIVANFLSDVEMIQEEIARSFGNGMLTDAQRKLHKEFVLQGNAFIDCTHLLPADRSKGERCFKGCFWPVHQPGLKVEVQVMTILQEAWDKKDHFLVYEPRRRGEPVEDRSEMEMFAMSELLYVADLTFDRLKSRILGDGRR